MTRFRKKERFIMIFTLTPNPSVDIFAESAHSRARHARIGGKGVNVSRFLARLGRESVCLFTAGERLGRFIAGSLAEEGIAARPFYAAGCENRVNIKFTRDERELNGRGRTCAAAERAALEYISENLSAGDVLALCGSLPDGADSGFYARAVSAAARAGAIAVVDTSGAPLAAAAAAGPYLAKPNLSEASSLPGYRRGMSATQAAELTVECGAQRALVSNGGEPAAYCERGGRAVTLPVRKVKAVSTVGAGDAMLAAWIDGMLSGLGGAECAARGVEFAGRIITEPLP